MTSFTILVLLTKKPYISNFCLISYLSCHFSPMLFSKHAGHRASEICMRNLECCQFRSVPLSPWFTIVLCRHHNLSRRDVTIFFNWRIIARPSLLMAWHPLQLPVVNSRSKMSDSCVVEHNNYSVCCCIVRLGVSCNFRCYKSVSLGVSIEFCE